jgi:hypothetical protein
MAASDLGFGCSDAGCFALRPQRREVLAGSNASGFFDVSGRYGKEADYMERRKRVYALRINFRDSAIDRAYSPRSSQEGEIAIASTERRR